MTTITGGALTQQLYQRLFDRLDADGDQSLSVDELQAADKAQPATSVAKVFGALDSDTDGKIGRSEMTGPAFSFTGDTLNALIAAQVGTALEPPAKDATGVQRHAAAFLGTPTPDEVEQVAALFARADTDGDGLLSTEEMAAEGAARRASALDAGYISGPIFYSIDANGDGALSPGEVRGGTSIGGVKGITKVIYFDEQSPEDQKRWMDDRADYNARNPDRPLPMPTILSSEEKQRERAQLIADQAERESGPAGTTKILSRDLGRLRDEAAADFVATPITDALATRLMRQLLAGWSAQPAKSDTLV
ncbi:EF-hand domain-containing protein [Caulobacter soli]|uniref:EF-hand domain-containing protein n=1 Tax=Caulobacter soli TaxID=2708539 RepID=UPI0013ED4573|nr:EF-hand domain-containing protein [Caulobacter soli]